MSVETLAQGQPNLAEVTTSERANMLANAAHFIAEDIQIVKLTAEDPVLAEDIARFRLREFDVVPDPSPAWVERRMKAMEDKSAVAAVDSTGKIRAVGIQSIDYRRGSAEVDEVVTAEDSRGQGLGHLVMAALEKEAKAEGSTKVTLFPVDDKAEKFYRKLGYQPTDTKDYTKAL